MRSDEIATSAGTGDDEEKRTKMSKRKEKQRRKQKEAIPDQHRLDISGLFAGTCLAPDCVRPLS